MRDINLIVIHSSATPPSLYVDADKIRDWHVNGNGWRDIGYHYVIKRDGEYELGRDIDGDGDVDEEIGAHAKGFNNSSIGICMIGGADEDGLPESNFTFEQYIALRALVRAKLDDYPDAKVFGHGDLEGVRTSCPSFNASSLFEN